MRRVRLLKRSNLRRGQTQRERRYGVLEMVWLRSSHNRRGDSRLTQQPRERKGCACNAALLRELAHALYHLAVSLFRLRVHLGSELVGFEALGTFALPGAGQTATRQRAPGNNADALGLAEGNHL